MTLYALGRLVAAIPTLLIVAVFIFGLVHIAPGDPALLIAGDNASPEQVDEIRARLHLDRSLPVQFGIWFGNAIQGDLGASVYSGKPVTELIAQRVEPTFLLAIYTMILTVLIAVPLGTIAAWKANGWLDRVIMGFSVAGFSVPVFATSYLLIYLFAVELRWFPVQGYKALDKGAWNTVISLTLPSVALALVFAALIARVTRAAVLEVIHENFVRTLKAKGMGTRRILVTHVLKTAGVPIVTVIGIGVAALIGGVVVTESVFNIPGIGRLTVDAIVRRDYPVVQGIILFFSLTLILVNLIVDLSYALFDPRVRG
ncbi:MAG: ABC transporter permease [Acuticoccus sp.]